MEMGHLLKGSFALLISTGSGAAVAHMQASMPGPPQPAAGSSAPGYSLTDSRQTFVLARGSTIYNRWKAWIEQKSAQSAHQYSTTKQVARVLPALRGTAGIGTITLTITRQTPPRSSEALASRTPPEQGPPSDLPASGTPGQRITVANQTPTAYQRWTYEWESPARDDHGAGAWKEIGIEAKACFPAGPTSALCELTDE